MNNIRYLYKSIFVPLLLLLMTLTLAWFSYDIAEESKAQSKIVYDKEISETETLYNQINQLKQKVELVNTYYGRFTQVHSTGMLMPSERVLWLDALMEVLVRHDLKKASINFLPRSSILTDEVLKLGFVAKRLKREQIIIEGELQHEADLISIFSEVKTRVNSLMLLESCELKNTVQPLSSWRSNYQFHKERGNVTMKCVINLLFFDVSHSEKGVP